MIAGFQIDYPRSRHHSLSVKKKKSKSDPKNSLAEIELWKNAAQKVEKCRHTV